MLILILPPDLPSLKERGTRGEASKLVILPFDKACKLFILLFALIEIFFEVFIDFNLLLKKAVKGELKSSDEELNKLSCALPSLPLLGRFKGAGIRREVIHILLKVFPCQP